MKDAELHAIKKEERRLKVEKVWLQKECKWFLKEKNRIMAQAAAVKARREKLEGKVG